jgi:hypothetical protein
MRKTTVILALLLLFTPLVAYPKPQKMKQASGQKVKGVVIRNNRARAKAGYKFVRKSPNLVAVLNKAKGVEHASFKCSCKSGEGSCNVETQGQDIFCLGSCEKCSLEVTLEPPPPAETRSSP